MAKSITGLPGYQWVYKGKQNPYTGEVAKARYAYNPATGDTLTYRAAYTKAHGGVSHEKRVPKEQRKVYKRKEKGYTAYGPFSSIKDVQARMPTIDRNKMTFLRVHGTPKKRQAPTPQGQIGKSKPGQAMYSTVSQGIRWQDMQANLTRIDAGTPGTNPFEQRIDRYLSNFSRIDRYYIVVKD